MTMRSPKRRPRPTPLVKGRTAARSLPGQLATGRVVAVDEDEPVAHVELTDRRVIEARLPQHVSHDWLKAAVEVAPVEAAVALAPRQKPILWCLLPGPEHAAVECDLELTGKRVVLRAGEELVIECTKGSIRIDERGNLTVKGRDLLSRATGTQRIKGAVIRLN
jgi:hypothetical protein